MWDWSSIQWRNALLTGGKLWEGVVLVGWYRASYQQQQQQTSGLASKRCDGERESEGVSGRGAVKAVCVAVLVNIAWHRSVGGGISRRCWDVMRIVSSSGCSVCRSTWVYYTALRQSDSRQCIGNTRYHKPHYNNELSSSCNRPRTFI